MTQTAPENLLEVSWIQLSLPCAVKAVPVALEILLSPYFHVFSWQLDTCCLHGCLIWEEGLLETSERCQKRHIWEINPGQEVSNPSFTVTVFALLLCSLSGCSSSCPPLLSSHRGSPWPPPHLSCTYWVSSTLWCPNTFVAPTPSFWILLFIWFFFFAKFSSDLYCSRRSQHIIHLSWALGAHA